PFAHATRLALVFGSPVPPTEPAPCRLREWWPRRPQKGSHCRYWPHRLRRFDHHREWCTQKYSNLRPPASKPAALIHLESRQVDDWQPGVQEKRFSLVALPDALGAGRERSLVAEVVHVRCGATTKGSAHPRPRCKRRNRRQLRLDAAYALASFLPQERCLAWSRSYWTDCVQGPPFQRELNPRPASCGSAPPPCGPAVIAPREFALDSARVGTLDLSLPGHQQISKGTLDELSVGSLPRYQFSGGRTSGFGAQGTPA